MSINNNNVTIEGNIKSPAVFSYEVNGQKFYEIKISVQRLSGVEDIIPVIVVEKLMQTVQCRTGDRVKIAGQFRSFNKWTGEKTRLILTVYAREIEVLTSQPDGTAKNMIYLDGFLCKTPVYRETPLGKKITDLLIAVNRSYGKTDYIPCICWNNTARFASQLIVGERVEIVGRIQSREYEKYFENGEIETRIAYEVSIGNLKYTK